MSLASEMRALDPGRPGEVWELLETWAEFVAVTAPFRAQLTRATGWYHHDETNQTTAEPATNPDAYKSHWWPRADTVAIVRRRGGQVIAVTVYSRVSPTHVENTIRFGERLPYGVIGPFLRPLGITKITAIVKDVGLKQALMAAAQAVGRPMRAVWDEKARRYDCEWDL